VALVMLLLPCAYSLDANSAGSQFVVAGRVMDRTTLKTMFVSMFGFMSTVVPLIIGLKPPAVISKWCDGTPAPVVLRLVGVPPTVTFSCCNATRSYVNATISSLLT